MEEPRITQAAVHVRIRWKSPDGKDNDYEGYMHPRALEIGARLRIMDDDCDPRCDIHAIVDRVTWWVEPDPITTTECALVDVVFVEDLYPKGK